MPTFSELQEIVVKNRRQKAILLYLVEHVDTNFRPVMGGDPLKALLSDDKQKIPYEDFEACVTSVLLPKIEALDAEMQQLETMDFEAKPPEPAAPEEQPPTVAVEPEPETVQAPAPTTQRRRRTG